MPNRLLIKRLPSVWIALRYLFRRDNVYAALINWVSLVGLVLGVAILTVVTSVMNGFDQEVKGRLLGVVPHVFIEKSVLAEEDSEAVLATPGIIGVERLYQGEAMLSLPGATQAVKVYGIDAKDGGSFIADSMVSGSLPMIQGAGIALGEPLVRLMGLALGDPTILVFPTSTGSGIVPVVQRFQLVATFAVGADPDYQLAIIDIARIEELGITNAGTLGWRVTLADPLSIGSWSSPVDAPLSTWAEQFGELFRAIEIEKGIMFALLALVVGLAAFNMVSGQALLVNDKRGDIAILSTMGARRAVIVSVFLVQGLVISLVGIALGLILGVTIASHADVVVKVLESATGSNMIEGTYFSSVPSETKGKDLVAIALLSFGLCTAAIVRPTLLAARANPAQELHSR
ncbi:MAG: FtsX-like permease family protein [Pseudomonadota bacterium]|nr:FtsX-like permease family protein [Pseudomonadota bacterium]